MWAVSDAAWGFFGVFVTAFASIVLALMTVLRRQVRMSTAVAEINRAVNHQPTDGPTLVERVISVERRQEEASAHRLWEVTAFSHLAHHVGCVLPPYPHHTESTEGDHLA